MLHHAKKEKKNVLFFKKKTVIKIFILLSLFAIDFKQLTCQAIKPVDGSDIPSR